MEKIRFIMFSGFIALFLLVACKKQCAINYPKDIKPIDWENYNDVYTVYWNYRTEGSVTNKKIGQDRGKDIMIYGWVCFGDFSNIHLFGLRESSNSGITCAVGAATIQIDSINYLHEQVRTKLDTSDRTKKCFIKGKLDFVEAPDMHCNWIVPKVVITNINDIYFEE